MTIKGEGLKTFPFFLWLICTSPNDRSLREAGGNANTKLCNAFHLRSWSKTFWVDEIRPEIQMVVDVTKCVIILRPTQNPGSGYDGSKLSNQYTI